MSIFRKSSSHFDSIDRLNYIVTPVLLISAFIISIITSSGLLGLTAPIECFSRSNYKSVGNKLVTDNCWSLIYSANEDGPTPSNQLLMHRWTPTILLFSALIFYAVYFIGRSCLAGACLDVNRTIEFVRSSAHRESLNQKASLVANYIMNSNYGSRCRFGLSLSLFVNKLLYTLLSGATLLGLLISSDILRGLTNPLRASDGSQLQENITTFGTFLPLTSTTVPPPAALRYLTSTSYFPCFPQVITCDARLAYKTLDDPKSSSTRPSDSFTCLVPINSLYRWIAQFFLLWLALIFLLTILSLFYYIGVVVPINKNLFVQRYLRMHKVHVSDHIAISFVRDRVNTDTFIFLRRLEVHLGDLFTSLVVTEMWRAMLKTAEYSDITDPNVVFVTSRNGLNNTTDDIPLMDATNTASSTKEHYDNV